jgi:hypothetical protein
LLLLPDHLTYPLMSRVVRQRNSFLVPAQNKI